MSCEAGPRLVEDGLVFYYDEANTKKSWKGKPTTNLQSDLSLNGMQDITFTYVGLEDGWKKYSVDGTWAAGTYPYCVFVTATSFTGGVAYSSGVYVKSNVMHKFDYKFTGMNYVNQPQDAPGSSFSIDQGDGTLFVGRVGFQYTSTTSQNGYLVSKPLSDGTIFVPATDFVWIKEGQIEEGLFTTPYINGTRSDTETLLDLTNNSTITPGSAITYNSDNTYEHVGRDDNSALSIPLSTSFNKLTGSINMWIYPFVYSGSNGLFVNRDSSVVNALDWMWIGSYGSGSTFYFRLGDGAACCANDLTISSWSSVAPINTWTNVCVTWASAGVSQIFVNGEFNTSKSIIAIPSTSPAATGRIGLGHYTTPDYGSWDGKISPTAIYNRVLTNNEITQNFEALRGRFGI